MLTHYQSLYLSYAVASACMLFVIKKKPSLSTSPPSDHRMARPWFEFLLSICAGVLTILIGQLYQRGIRLPHDGTMGPWFEAINQTAIFLPFPLLLWLRRQPLTTSWIHLPLVGRQIIVGSAITLVTLFAYSLVRADHPGFLVMLRNIYHPSNLGNAVQVFWEDFAIAVVMVRLTKTLGRPIVSAALVSFLFVSGHIPPMLTNGATLADFSGLLLDFGLGLVVISVLQRSRNIVWFWCIHFAMDMTQFYGSVSTPG